MLLPKTVLRNFACSLRSKTDDQLKGLLKLINTNFQNLMMKVQKSQLIKKLN